MAQEAGHLPSKSEALSSTKTMYHQMFYQYHQNNNNNKATMNLASFL
jgi:hypothetical protein